MNTRLRGSARIAVAALCLGLALAPAAPAMAGSADAPPWDAAITAVFRVFTAMRGIPFACTGWYLAPVSSKPAVSVYVTAGHCPTPLLVKIEDGFESTLVIARLHSEEAGSDLTIAERRDPRTKRVFLPLSATPAQPGERALVVGYGDGILTTTVVTAVPACQRPFICFASPVSIRGGLSGSPIVSLRTSRVLGMLVASPLRWRASDPYIIIATSASAIRASVQLALPGLGRTASAGIDSHSGR